MAVQLTFKRYETKYMLTQEQYDRLRILMKHYMEADQWGLSTICNVYYDTPSRLLVRRSAEHPDYKEKVRVRSYGVRKPDAPVFLELKKKIDGVVYKRRCTVTTERAAALLSGHGDPQTQIEHEIDFTCKRYGGLEPAFFIAYDREAFYGIGNRDFRMTFDRRIRSRTTDMRLDLTDEAEQYLDDNLALMEVKTCGAIPLWLVEYLSGEGIRKVSFSKVGVAWQRQLEAELARRRSARRATPAHAPAGAALRNWTGLPTVPARRVAAMA